MIIKRKSPFVMNGLFLLLVVLFFLLSQYLVYDSDDLLLYISFEHRVILYGKVQLFIYYTVLTELLSCFNLSFTGICRWACQ